MPCSGASPVASSKESVCSAGASGDVGSIPQSGRYPGEGMQPTPVFSPGKPPGQRTPAGFSPWGSKELDTTEHNDDKFHP